ncbi:DNA cytosine methyltransferase, partial [Psychrobacter sp. T6-2]
MRTQVNLDLFSNENEVQDYRRQNTDIKFIDLFAGIGGFHLALSSLGAKCVFASEKDKFARQTYKENFDTTNFEFNDDIRNISPDQVPDHDVLCAGFPCQPFSQAGLKKGFKDGEDSERGNLFYCILDILEAKKPRAFILENVRHLIKHDEGRTFETIQKLLKEAGYSVQYQVLKASDYNIPQLRPRVFIVGFRGGEDLPPFIFPPKVPLTYTMSDVFQGDCEREVGFTLRVGGKGSTIDDRRNYEFYRVDGEVRRIDIPEAKKIMAL